jgi:hypothetical protein
MAVVGSLSSPTVGYATACQFAAIAASFGLCAAGWLFDDANANRRRRRRGDRHDLSFVDRRAGAENSQFAGYAYFHPPTQIFQQHDFAAFAATMKNPLTVRAKNSCQAQRARYQDDRAS